VEAHPHLDGQSIAGILALMHGFLATKFEIAELAYTDDETKQLGDAITNVARHYDVRAPAKYADLAALIVCLGMMEIPRFYLVQSAIRTKQALHRTTAAQRENSNVFTVHPTTATYRNTDG
jgi:hypothetical protein